MKKVQLEGKGSIALVRLNNGDSNIISPELIDDFFELLPHVEKNFFGFVLAGGAKFFSIGFDLPKLLSFNRSELLNFLCKFNNLVLHLFTLPFPTCCVVSGHAIAGGNILALTCDFRFATSRRKLIGLNEIKLGVPVPFLAELILRQIVGDQAANRMLFSGDFLPISEAKQFGLVDEVFAQEEIEAKALEKVSQIANFPRPAFYAMKANRIEPIKERFEANFKAKNEIFLDCWFSETSQDLLKEASKKF